MERYVIRWTVAFFFALFVIIIAGLLYGISRIDFSHPEENQPDLALAENPLSPSSSGEVGSDGSGGSGSGELGTVSPLSKNASVGGSGGSAGGGGGGIEGEEQPKEAALPSDFYTAPCGIYFTTYGMCNGTCEEGICTQEGRSCYCKLV